MVAVTIDAIRKSLPESKNRKSSLWVQYVVRPISFPVSVILARFGLNADQVSVISLGVCLAAFFLFAVGKSLTTVAAAFLLNFWLVLDCVDGNLARFFGATKYGKFLDGIGVYFISFSFLVIGFSIGYVEGDLTILFLGALATSSDLFARLIHHQFTKVALLRGDIDIQSLEKSTDRSTVIFWIDKNLSYSGIFMPAVLVLSVVNKLNYFIAFYSIFNFMAALFVLVKYIRAAFRLNNEG